MSMVNGYLVTTYADAVALLLIVGLLLLSSRLRQRKNEGFRLLYFLIFSVVLGCASSLLYYLVQETSQSWSRMASLITRTLTELSIVELVYLWILYVDYKLYGKRDHRTIGFHVMFIPGTVIAVLLVINLFTGFVFSFTPDNVFQPTFLYYLLSGSYYIYFAMSVVIVTMYDMKGGRTRFFRISPMIVSVVAGTMVRLFSPYDTVMLGLSVGVTLLYFSMINELRFEDAESGLYNKAYLSYVLGTAVTGKCEYRGALIFEIDGNVPASFDIMQKQLKQSGDVIRIEENRVLLLSDKDSRAVMQLLSSVVEEAVNAFNEQHPGEKIGVKARCRMKAADEDTLSFINAAVNEEQAGDYLRGVVSMMTELDRLDRELKLATDIQASMLPMNFPPFPDRTEFDLYASMNPAKEVAGDFYDFFLIDDDHLALIIADVSGKGIPAALFMMVSKTLIENQLMDGAGPSEALRNVNTQLCERNDSMMFVTVWLAVLEISTGRVTECNAGHENPAYKRKGSGFELVKYKHNIFCGAMSGTEYEEHPFELQPGDSLFVYTDGVTEATNEKKEQFGERGLIEALNEMPEEEPEKLINHVREAVDRFADGAPQFDDITMLCLKYHGCAADVSARD